MRTRAKLAQKMPPVYEDDLTYINSDSEDSSDTKKLKKLICLEIIVMKKRAVIQHMLNEVLCCIIS